jgi:hypothetical protein
MLDTTSYHCPCGWSRIVLDGETLADARRAHEGSMIHQIEHTEGRRCPTCQRPGVLTAREARKGYQCRDCTQRDEIVYGGDF